MRPTVLLTLLLAAIGGSLQAQSKLYRDDAEVRAHFSLETELSRRWTIHLDQQYRFGDNVSRLTRGSADLGLTYKINKHIRLLGDYIYLQNWSNSGYGYYFTRHWFSGAVVLRTNVRRWRFVYRNMVQMRNDEWNSEDAYNYRLYNRNKLSIRYEATKRWTFYTAHEIYIPLNNPQNRHFDRTRHFGGLLFKTFRNQQLELYFMYQHQWEKGRWWDQTDKYPNPYFKRDFVYGIGYGIEI